MQVVVADSDHDDDVLVAEEERVLVDHRLDDVLEVRPHRLEPAEIVELDRQECGPPADRQVLAVHAVQLAVLRDSAWFFFFFFYSEILMNCRAFVKGNHQADGLEKGYFMAINFFFPKSYHQLNVCNLKFNS